MTNEICSVSIHGQARLKQRCKLKNSRAVQRNASLALERGKRAADLSSWEHNYLQREVECGKLPVAYNGLCYIFSADYILITAFLLPSWFGKPKHFDGKERIRNYKKYSRYYTHTYEQN